jgi:hypothetical protein
MFVKPYSLFYIEFTRDTQYKMGRIEIKERRERRGEETVTNILQGHRVFQST